MVEVCRRAGVRFFVHENWRWQTPIMALRKALVEGTIGFPFRARIEMISGFPVFENQPALKELEQFILTDLGSHLLDVARVLFGEAESLFCHTQRMRPDIRGEDSATVLMQMGEGASVICAMAYAGNFLERERFPETFFFVEGTRGSIELGPDYWLRITTSEGTLARRHPPPHYAWADPAYDVVHASIVPCNRDLLNGLQGMAGGQTNAEDNLRTVELVFASYESALRKEVIRLKP
jgi:D-apiose dehydrogenase